MDNWSTEELAEILDLAERQKQDPGVYKYARPLNGRVVGLFFEKASMRTRLSFEVATYQLGGQTVFVGPEAGRIGEREALRDLAKVAARYLDCLVMRTYKHETIVEVARFCDKPVINGLSDERHPCQALGDVMTIKEKLGKLAGARVAYIGDANNVCRSLAVGLTKFGASLTVASPEGYGLTTNFLKSLPPGHSVRQVVDPMEAATDADIIYTDVWTSMGQENERDKRREIFRAYQVNEALLERAPRAFVMHCMPAHRGEEITDHVMDGARSIVYDQAENRLHVQRALLCRLLGAC
jgi:ornithine carbamoyltransferase